MRPTCRCPRCQPASLRRVPSPKLRPRSTMRWLRDTRRRPCPTGAHDSGAAARFLSPLIPTRFLSARVTPVFLWLLSFGRLTTRSDAQDRLREQVLVATVHVVARRGAGVVVGAAEALRVEAGALEGAAAAEVDHAVAGRIARQRAPLDDHGVLVAHGLAAQVDARKARPEHLFVAARQLVESRERADLVPVAVVLGRLGHHHAALRTDGQARVVGRRAQHGAVGHQRLGGGAFLRVPVADEVGLQHHAPAARHQLAERVPIGVAPTVGVEPQREERRAHGLVHVVRRSVGDVLPEQRAELRVGLARAEGRCQTPVVRGRPCESTRTMDYRVSSID